MDINATHRGPEFWPAAIGAADDGPPYPVSSFESSCWLSKDKGTPSLSTMPGSFIPLSNGSVLELAWAMVSLKLGFTR